MLLSSHLSYAICSYWNVDTLGGAEGEERGGLTQMSR